MFDWLSEINQLNLESWKRSFPDEASKQLNKRSENQFFSMSSKAINVHHQYTLLRNKYRRLRVGVTDGGFHRSGRVSGGSDSERQQWSPNLMHSMCVCRRGCSVGWGWRWRKVALSPHMGVFNSRGSGVGRSIEQWIMRCLLTSLFLFFRTPCWQLWWPEQGEYSLT